MVDFGNARLQKPSSCRCECCSSMCHCGHCGCPCLACSALPLGSTPPPLEPPLLDVALTSPRPRLPRASGIPRQPARGVALFESGVGHPCFRAPEASGHSCDPGCEADLWSAGVLLFGMFTASLYGVRYHPRGEAAPEPVPLYRATHAELERAFDQVPFNEAGEPGHLPGKSRHMDRGPRSLVAALVKLDPTERLPVAEIAAHPWIYESYASRFLDDDDYHPDGGDGV